MSSLQEAREAIQSGNLPAAQAIIADVLKSDQNNAEAWFLLSEATAGDRKLIFLNKAIAIDPTFQEAIDRKAELESPAEPEPQPEPEPTFEEEPEDELFEEFEEEEEEDFLEVAPANFDDFSVADDDDEPAYVDPSPIESSPPAEDVTPSAVAETASKTSAVKKEDKEEESEPSNLLNNIGFAFSLSLSVVLLILFLRAFLSLF